MLQLPVELPPRAYAPGGPNEACRRNRVKLMGVVLPAPAIGQDLSFRSCGEQLGIEEFIPKPAVVDEVERSSYDSEKLFSHEDPGSM